MVDTLLFSTVNRVAPAPTGSQLNFTVPRESLQINVTNAHSVESTEADGQTHVTCALPPTSTLEVQWTQAVRQVIQPIVPTESAAEAAAAAKKKKKEAIVTVGQSLLCLIGEGVMAITCQVCVCLSLSVCLSLFLCVCVCVCVCACARARVGGAF